MIARWTRTVRRSIASKPWRTTSSIKTSGSGPRSAARSPSTSVACTAMTANAATIAITIAACSRSGRRPPRRATHIETTAPAATETDSSNIDAGDGPSAPASIARLANAAAAALHRVGPVIAVAGSTTVGRSWIGRCRNPGRGTSPPSSSSRSICRCAAIADHRAASSASCTTWDGPSPARTSTSCPSRRASPRVQRNRSGSAASRSMSHRSSIEVTRSCTINSSVRSDDAQWTEFVASPRRHGRTPSISPPWLPRRAATEPSLSEVLRSTSSSGPCPIGATWSGSMAVVCTRRHQNRPAGPATWTVTVSSLTIPGDSKRTVTLSVSDVARPAGPSGRSASAMPTTAPSGRVIVIRRRSIARGDSGPSIVTSTARSSPTVATAGATAERTCTERADHHPAMISYTAATSAAARIRITAGRAGQTGDRRAGEPCPQQRARAR